MFNHFRDERVNVSSTGILSNVVNATFQHFSAVHCNSSVFLFASSRI